MKNAFDFSVKHKPFQSIYRPDFEVVEERRGRYRLYPHTEQLPILWRALNLEFLGSLPNFVAQTDRRGDGFRKIVRQHAGLVFCNAVNAARPDDMRLHSLIDSDLVTRAAIVQQITKDHWRGKAHYFKFYPGEDFFTEIRFAGRRVVFANHVLLQFSKRVPNRLGDDLSLLLLAFFGNPHHVLPLNHGRAFVIPYGDSILAFPFRVTDQEFFIFTCLTANEIHGLRPEYPPMVLNPHYDGEFAIPRVRHWRPTAAMQDLIERWKRKAPLPPPLPPTPESFNWPRAASRVRDDLVKIGHGPGSQLYFCDHVPGPSSIGFRPGQSEPHIDELELYQREHPGKDWEALFAAREQAMLNMASAEYACAV